MSNGQILVQRHLQLECSESSQKQRMVQYQKNILKKMNLMHVCVLAHIHRNINADGINESHTCVSLCTCTHTRKRQR